jgi:hypothetical protein
MPEPSIRSGQGLASINIRLRSGQYEHQTGDPQQPIVQLGLRTVHGLSSGGYYRDEAAPGLQYG